MRLELQAELLKMQAEDQSLLKKLIDNGDLKEDEYHPEMKALHERNNSRIKDIIQNIGWPTISLVGKDASKAAWLIVQHAILDEKFMAACLELLQEAIKNDDAESWCFAYLKDRTLTMKGKPQIYGTQFDMKNGKVVPFPIESTSVVDELRKEIGLDTVAEAAQRIQERYKL
ncbi:hypothetical protein HWV01_08060 [Moritella sp. 5]|uniref:DUF6624 domain-containing protein n=1 Tax=Moritella sp. 5 TaxID=2746231 RepID=UPI001BA5DB7D|nr:DUF6624 domain-containing protein [Moritella sp. 5]QUM80243.1 hypothetical protein HWV01_08060 [Moritella sp. 5]